MVVNLPLVITPEGKWRNPLSIIKGIDPIDLMTIPLYVVLILFITYIVQSKISPTKTYGRFLMPAVGLKLFSSIAFAAVYVYHYDGIGDTFYYFEGSKVMHEAWLDSPELGFRVLLQPAGEFEPFTFPYTSRMPGFWRGDVEMVSMYKVVGTIMLFGFQSYWLTTLLVSIVGFTGLWKLFRFFADQYPDLTNKAALAVFFIPSSMFWGSGILKDTICFGSLGWVVWCMYQIFGKKNNVVTHIFVAGVFSVIILSLKAYILYAVFPAIAVWLIMRFRPRNESIILKYTVTPAIIAIIGIGVYFAMQSISDSSEKYAIDNLEQQAKGFHSDHGNASVHEDASIYSLGEISYTPIGLLSKFPAAVNVTYFRPYLWEVSDPFQLLSSIESLMFFFLLLQTLWRVGPFKFVKLLGSNADIGFCLAFALLFGFSVGFTAYNFGALVRFKIPVLPFYVMLMYLIQHEYFKEKQLKALAPIPNRKRMEQPA